MAWSYRRRIKIIPGVHLNFSKNGISTSIGVKGASVTFGKKGTYLNTSVPGFGISSRQKLSDNSNSETHQRPDVSQIVEPIDNIFSVDVQHITSQNMQGIKESIISAHEQRNELKADQKKIELSLKLSKIKLVISYILLLSIILKKFVESVRNEVKAKKDAIEQLKDQIENCHVKLDVEFDSDIKNKYDNVVNAFKKLIASNKVWHVTAEYQQDTRTTRSAASTAIKRIDVRIGVKSLEDIKSQFDTLWIKNSHGADIYFYPSFVVMYSTQKKFALIGFDELKFNQREVRFVETGTIPQDSKVIDRTWAKVNKNGSPDKRFKGNYQIPIVKYGEMNLSSETGLNEEFQFSNYEYSEDFAKSFLAYQKLIKSLKQVS
ncbi:MAG TPA: DUF4236 domain-containing protein [Cytophagales bacterium]|jgi:hypothetical protein|nr:DUF4236 domain-containing protein [Cytophagales bacterium]